MAASPRVILVTDPRYDDETLAHKLGLALSVAGEGEVAVQLRDKRRSGREVFELGRRLRPLCKDRGALFVVNDRVDMALALEADGVHLGGASVSVADARALLGAEAWISVAAHSASELARLSGEGADAATLSPIFASPGKGEPLGIEALTRGKELAPALFLYALGGIDESNAAACFGAGATGIAAIRAVFDADEPAEVMRRFLDAGR